MASVKRKAAKQAAKSRAARKAARRAGTGAVTTRAGRKATGAAARYKAADVAAQARAHAKDAGLDDTAAQVAERIRDSETLTKAQAKGAELADRTRARIRDAELDSKAADLAARVKSSDSAQQTMAAMQRLSDEQLGRLGGWLATSSLSDKLGVRPAKRRLPSWLALLLGALTGYAIGTLTAPKRGEEMRSELAERSNAVKDDFAAAAARLQQDTADVGAPPAQKPVADEVRTRLGEDPRTSGLPKLNVNVAEGTVFVRGSLPAGFDEAAIRDVVASVPGVEDVDLQLTAG